MTTSFSVAKVPQGVNPTELQRIMTTALSVKDKKRTTFGVQLEAKRNMRVARNWQTLMNNCQLDCSKFQTLQVDLRWKKLATLVSKIWCLKTSCCWTPETLFSSGWEGKLIVKKSRNQPI
uniref:Uncharacterized protein n=1 Tax=Cacopsylla melanoneura TaxID=428564 RepID=A0A8D9B445_9HEMI